MTKVRVSGVCMPAFPTDGIVLVGVCAAGKTTVSRLLKARGIPAAVVAQEHSAVPGLYRRHGPRRVVLLCANWETVHRRRHLSWNPDFYQTEWHRLAQARQEAGFIVHTDALSAVAVTDLVAHWWFQLARQEATIDDRDSTLRRLPQANRTD